MVDVDHVLGILGDDLPLKRRIGKEPVADNKTLVGYGVSRIGLGWVVALCLPALNGLGPTAQLQNGTRSTGWYSMQARRRSRAFIVIASLPWLSAEAPSPGRSAAGTMRAFRARPASRRLAQNGVGRRPPAPGRAAGWRCETQAPLPVAGPERRDTLDRAAIGAFETDGHFDIIERIPMRLAGGEGPFRGGVLR